MKDSTMVLILSVVMLLVSLVGIVIGKPVVLCGAMTFSGIMLMIISFCMLFEGQ
mgnify:FL=1